MKKIKMYSDTAEGITEIQVAPSNVERMESIGWSKTKPKKQKEKPPPAE